MTKYHFRILTYSDMGSFSGIIDNYTFTTAAAVTPVIQSATHAAQEKWYGKNEAEFRWGQHLDIKHYLYMIDQEPDTIPEPAVFNNGQQSVIVKTLMTACGTCI